MVPLAPKFLAKLGRGRRFVPSRHRTPHPVQKRRKMGAERLQNHESGYPNEIPRHNRPFFNSRRCRLQCLVFTVLVVVIHGQQTVIGSTLKNNLLSDIALSGKDDNMLGQVWKKVQEQLAAATRTENRQKPRAKKQDTVANKPKHNPAIKRKEVLDFYANRLQNTTHFHPCLLYTSPSPRD